MADNEKVKVILKAAKDARANQQQWLSTWQEVADYMMPSRATFTAEISPGAPNRQRKVVDSTAEEALELLAAGLHGMLTSRSQRWFYLQPDNPQLRDVHAVRLWIDEVLREMYSMLNAPSSQFHSQIDQAYMDLGAFGTTVMYSQEGGDSGITFMTRHLGECAIAENPLGMVDTLYRSFKWSCDKIVKQWGAGKLPENIRTAYEQGHPIPDMRITHAVLPRQDRNYDRLDAKGLPWASMWILEDHATELEEGGYHEFPYHVARWRMRTGEIYGTGPGIRLLPDVKMLQSIYTTVIKAAQKKVDPPLNVPESMRGIVRTVPGGMNYYDGNVASAITPIETRGDVRLGEEILEQQRNLIRRGFLRDAFDVTSDSNGANVKAQFVLQRRDDKFRQLSSTFSYLDVGLLEPIIIRTYNAGLRQGRFPSVPDELNGQKLVVDYVSPVARAQRTTELDDVNRLLELVAALGAFDAGAFANIDSDATIRIAGEQLVGIPAGVLRSREDVAAMRQQQAQEKADAQAAAMIPAGAAALKDVAAAHADFASRTYGQVGLSSERCMIDHFRKRARLLAAYHTCFDSEAGQIVMADLVKRTNLLMPRFVDPSDGMAQAMAMAQVQGQKNIVLAIIRELDITLEQLLEQQRDEEAYGNSDTTD